MGGCGRGSSKQNRTIESTKGNVRDCSDPTLRVDRQKPTPLCPQCPCRPSVCLSVSEKRPAGNPGGAGFAGCAGSAGIAGGQDSAPRTPPHRTPLRAHTPCAQTHKRIYKRSTQLSSPMMVPSLTATARPVHSHTPADAYDPAKRVSAGHHPIRPRTSTAAKTRATCTTPRGAFAAPLSRRAG